MCNGKPIYFWDGDNTIKNKNMGNNIIKTTEKKTNQQKVVGGSTILAQNLICKRSFELSTNVLNIAECEELAV